MKRVLFICGQNRLRSPTAEQLFANYDGIEVQSAGVNPEADNPVSPELLQWADIIFVMERSQRAKLRSQFRKFLNGQRLICLDIPDDYGFMDPELIRLLEARVPRHLPKPPAESDS